MAYIITVIRRHKEPSGAVRRTCQLGAAWPNINGCSEICFAFIVILAYVTTNMLAGYARESFSVIVLPDFSELGEVKF
jgi:hypothetical protein